VAPGITGGADSCFCLWIYIRDIAVGGLFFTGRFAWIAGDLIAGYTGVA